MNFYCANHSFEKAKVVLVGVPYDGTSTFRPGSRFAPDSIREASYGIESYSPYQKKDLRDIKICDLSNIPLSFGDKSLNLRIVESFVKRFYKRGKKLLFLGGEHLVTYPIVKAIKERISDLAILHIDAHSDLADSYRGERLSHATVMRRVAELIGFENLFQLGIRSMTKHDELLPFRDRNMCTFNLADVEEFAGRLKGKKVYLSLDLDVLDPSVLPGTGTPEPGGVSYKELLDALLVLGGLDIVAADIVELSPHYDHSGISSITAASIARELIILLASQG